MKNWLILGGILLAILGLTVDIGFSEEPKDLGSYGFRQRDYEPPRMTEEEKKAAELKRKEADRVAQERRARYAAGLPVEEKAWGDELQQLFLKLTVTTTQEDFERYVAGTSLFLNKDRLDYKVAF